MPEPLMSAAPPANAFVVCSTQRSGSTLLCSLLASTGVAGDPQEYFEAMAETGIPPHPSFFLAGLPRTGVGVRDDPRPMDVPAYSDLRLVDGWTAHLARTFELGTTPNGVFSTQLMWNLLPEVQRHAAAVPELAELSGIALLNQLFGDPGYVWMRRIDKVQQAISLWRALQTRAWRRERTNDDGSPRELRYSFDAIEHLRRRLHADDEAWGPFFLESGIDPRELTYETDVEPDPGGAVARVLARVGVLPPVSWQPATSLLRQSDDVNHAWRTAYDRDAAEHLIV
jgi:LPS sulfotransferase NodH